MRYDYLLYKEFASFYIYVYNCFNSKKIEN